MEKYSQTSEDLRHIRRVDIETHSNCNRSCNWCVQNQYNFRNKRMDNELFEKIIDELKEFKFGIEPIFINRTPENFMQASTYYRDFTKNQPKVSFTGLSEPLMFPDDIKSKVEIAWDKLPSHTELVLNTNGDLLTKESIEGLLVTTLNVMDYDCKGEDYWTKKVEEAGGIIIDTKELNFQGVLAAHTSCGMIRVNLNWPKEWELENRAGALEPDEITEGMKWVNDLEERAVPCPEPTYYINICSDGSVMPCCHMSSHIDKHKDYILGNIRDNTLLEIYNSDKAVMIRKSLMIEEGMYPEPCRNCQKIRGGLLTKAPNGFDYVGERYRGNKINTQFYFKPRKEG